MRPTPSSTPAPPREGAATSSSSGRGHRGHRSLLPLALGLTAALAASAGVAEAFVAPLPPTTGAAGRQCQRQQQQGSSSSRSGQQPPLPASTRLWARRRKKGDDADFERFNLDELRDEARFESVEEIDPEMFRPSKMEYYVPPPVDEMEAWDVTDTRCVVCVVLGGGRGLVWVACWLCCWGVCVRAPPMLNFNPFFTPPSIDQSLHQFQVRGRGDGPGRGRGVPGGAAAQLLPAPGLGPPLVPRHALARLGAFGRGRLFGGFGVWGMLNA